jgi:hypothetical protein
MSTTGPSHEPWSASSVVRLTDMHVQLLRASSRSQRNPGALQVALQRLADAFEAWHEHLSELQEEDARRVMEVLDDVRAPLVMTQSKG